MEEKNLTPMEMIIIQMIDRLCNEELDKDFQLWKKDKIIKRCPKCRFYTEKNVS